MPCPTRRQEQGASDDDGHPPGEDVRAARTPRYPDREATRPKVSGGRRGVSPAISRSRRSWAATRRWLASSLVYRALQGRRPHTYRQSHGRSARRDDRQTSGRRPRVAAGRRAGCVHWVRWRVARS